ncbi:MAG: O-antigen ligase family protein, partial [Elusimicrobia bacterium]|nr:O-antigen ligase family protein [Elusimicrobiota bacterium]
MRFFNDIKNKIKDEYRVIDVLPSAILVLSFFLGGLREFNEWTVFTVMFIGIVILFRNKISIRKAGLWAVFALWILISIFFSHVPLESFWQFAKYILFILFLGLTASREELSLKIWVFVVFSFALLSAIIVFHQAPNFNLPLPNNPNYTAAFLAACAAALVLIIISVHSIRERFYSGVLLITFFAAIISLRSRGALLAFFIVSMLILIHRKYYRAFVFSLILILVGIILMPQELLGEILKIYDPNAFQRLNIWRVALEGTYLYPIWGYGAGGFEKLFAQLKFPAYDGLSYFGHYGRHAHSEILNIASTSGIIAAFIFMAAFVKSLKFKSKSNIYTDIAKVFAITVFCQSCLDVIFYSGSLNLLFFGSLGFIASSSNFKNNQKTDKTRNIILFLSAFVLVTSLLIKQNYNNLCVRKLIDMP